MGFHWQKDNQFLAPFAFDANIELHFWLISTAYSPFYIIERNDEIDAVSDTNDATSEPETSNNKEEGNSDNTLKKIALRLKEYLERNNYDNYFLQKTQFEDMTFPDYLTSNSLTYSWPYKQV